MPSTYRPIPATHDGTQSPFEAWWPMNISIVLLILSLATDGFGPEKPPALIAMIEARKSARTVDINWTLKTRIGPEQYRECGYVARRAANGDYIFEQRGDQDGVVEYDDQGRARSAFPLITLYTADGMYQVRETVTILDVVSDPKKAEMWRKLQAQDALAFGLTPLANQTSSRFETAVSDFINPRLPRVYKQSSEGDLFVVTMRVGYSEPYHYVVWHIDPKRNWNAERIACRYGESEDSQYEAVISLEQYDGFWFPDAIVYYQHHLLTHVYSTRRARFNQPGDPAAFTPADIGAEPGFTITYRGAPPYPLTEMMLWGGDKIMPASEYSAAVKRGEIQDGPLIQQFQLYGEIKRPYPDLDPVDQNFPPEDVLSPWREYVLNFIVKHALNAEQTQKSWQILSQCEIRGRAYLHKQKSELDRLNARLDAARGTKAFPRVREETAECRHKLLLPIGDIFEQDLKPRLDGLLTRSQRARAQTSDQPAQHPVGERTSPSPSP